MIKQLISNPKFLYFLTFIFSFLISIISVPLFRHIAVKLNILDHPSSDIKTHKYSTPYLGGLPIWIGWAASLFLIRFITGFPTGTLRSLRGIMVGSVIILSLGLIDDILPKGLGFKKKFLFQFLAALTLLLFDIRLNFVSPYSVAAVLSIFWVVVITNSFNLVDIMDGLSSGLALIASLAMLFIALPTEQIYVNFCAAALAGGCAGFLPFNLSKSKKIFMGDTGSLTIGFILAAISMGTSYTKENVVGLVAPLLILAIPVYDTLLVTYFRIKKGRSPFLGSKDHFALRLEIFGLKRNMILLISYAVSAVLSFSAYLVTRLEVKMAMIEIAVILVFAFFAGKILGKIEVK